MLFLTCFIFVSFIATKADETECNKDNLMKCGDPRDIAKNFPENVGEMAEKCQVYDSFFRCLINYEKSCGSYRVEVLESYLKTMSKFCDKHSTLFNAVGEHGKCFKKVVLNDQNTHKINFDKLEKRIEELSRDLNLADGDEYLQECFYEALDISSYAKEISQICGEVAKELFLLIVKETGLINVICENATQEVSDFVEKLGMQLEPSMSIEEFVDFFLSQG